MTRFDLSKWYLDVVSNDGRVAILYVARLRLGPLALHAQHLLRTGPEGAEVRTRWTVRPAPAPVRDHQGGFRLASPGLGARAHGQALAPSHEATLWTGQEGAVTWRCLAPRADVELSADGETWRGLGYLEQLRLTVPPWRLPIRALRWGRLLSPRGGLVWIDWQGPAPLRLVLDDGAPTAAPPPDEPVPGQVEGPPRLQRLATLRDAPLRRTLPALLRHLVPGGGLALQETKWLSRGEVGGASGFAVHELVSWA